MNALTGGGLIDYIGRHTRSQLISRSMGAGWARIDAALWEQGDEAFTTPPADTFFLARCVSGFAVAEIRFDALAGSPRTLVTPGVLCFLPAGNAAEVTLEGRYRAVHMMIPPAIVIQTAAERFRGDPARIAFQGFVGHTDPRLDQIARSILQRLQAADDRLSAEQLAIALAERLLTFASDAEMRPGDAPSLTPLQLRNAIDYLEGNLHTDFGLPEIAAYCGVDPCRFARAFEADTGQSLSLYRTERRVDRVRGLMAGPVRPSDAELAERAGFEDVTAMDAAFRRVLGVSFANWRDGRLG